MTERLTEQEVAELARLFPPGPATTALLGRAGFDVTKLPSTGQSAYDYWSLINVSIEDGAFGDGRRRVLALARGRFPYNRVLLEAGAPEVWRVLFVGASPLDRATLRADLELRRVREAGGPVDLHYLPAATVTDLSQVRVRRPDLLHLACHGQGPLLVFDDGAGGAHTVHAADLAQTFQTYEQELGVRLRGIVLNACDSAAAAQILHRCADVVVAHREDLPDDDGIAFAGAFYRALAGVTDLAAAARIAVTELVTADPARRSIAEHLVVLEGGAR